MILFSLKRGPLPGACSYYGTRKAVPAAHVVLVPYASLIHKGTREALGVEVKGNVIVIDEAHNLIETINNIYSCEITSSKLGCAHSQLSQYLERYEKRMKPSNTLFVRQLLFVLEACLKFISKHSQGKKQANGAASKDRMPLDNKVLTVNDFLFALNIDNINPFRLQRFIDDSELCKKLNGFADKYIAPAVDIAPKAGSAAGAGLGNNDDSSLPYQARNISALAPFASFLDSLNNADKDGRIVVDLSGTSPAVRFLMLNPAVHFKEIVDQAHAVVLAGGSWRCRATF